MTTQSAIRAAIAARIVALGGDWKESRFLPDRLGYDPSSVAHLSYSVDLPNGRAVGNRQKPTIYQQETVIIRFTYQVKPKDQISSYDSALDVENTVVSQLLSSGWTSLFQLVYVSSSRSSLETGEWRRHELTFNALFYLATE